VLETVRDTAPVVLVPAAWAVAAATHAGRLSPDVLLVAHLVMAAFVAAFAAPGWSAMSTGALRAWRAVLVAGLVCTLAGIAGFLAPAFGTPLLAVSLVGWLLLPTAGLAYTARAMPGSGAVYAGSAGLSFLGAALSVVALAGVAGSLLAGLALVGLGQAVGIADATVRQ